VQQSMPDWLRLDSHGALVPQIYAHVCAAGFPSSAIGIVQGVWDIQQQATLRVIRSFDPVEFNTVETKLTFRAIGGSLADRKTLAADFRAGNENKKVGAAADRLSIRVHMGNPDLALGVRLCLTDQITDPIQIVARPHFGGFGCRGKDDEERPYVSHMKSFQ
jgi:hypothetical protein